TLAISLGREVLTDDLPRLEYALAALPPDQSLGFATLDVWLADVPWLTEDSGTVEDILVAPVIERRIARVRHRVAALERLRASLDALELDDADRAHALGLLAEHRGRVDEAIANYEAAATGPSLSRSDSLSRRVGDPSGLLERALARDAKPDDFSAALL